MPLFGLSSAKVVDEYAPGRPAGDNSAFDVAVEYARNGKRGLVGAECKYTDTLSPTEYRRDSCVDLHLRAMIGASDVASFAVITYADFIARAQQQDLSWSDREWTMLFWARYCGMSLSEPAFEEA